MERFIVIAGSAEQRARELITFADGVEAAGWIDYARRARVVARDVLELADQLAAERSARVAMQRARDEVLRLLAGHHTDRGAQLPEPDAEPGPDFGYPAEGPT